MKNVILLSIAFLLNFTAFQVCDLHKIVHIFILSSLITCIYLKTKQFSQFLNTVKSSYCNKFVIYFLDMQSMQSLQSSLNRVEGLGTVCLSVIYGCLMISCLFLPSLLIKMFGCKYTITVCFIPYLLFMAGNLYADWVTMIPASILVGLAAAPLWAAKCTYLTEMGKRYAEVSMLTEEAAINRFFGMFFMAFQSGMSLVFEFYSK